MKLKNQKNRVIICHSLEHGQRIKEYWIKEGVINRDNNWGFDNFLGENIYCCYGIVNGCFSIFTIEEALRKNCEFILLEEPEENKFPREVLVSDDETEWEKRVIAAYLEKARYPVICYSNVSELNELDDIKYEMSFNGWRYFKEIEPEKEIVLTYEEIAKKFNVDPEKLKIKR